MSMVTVSMQGQPRARGPGRRFVLLACLLWLAACTPSYVAVSGTATISPGDDPDDRHALEYPIGAPDERRGKIELWSEGAEREELDGSLQTLIHVGMVVHNTSSEPVRLDREQLRLDDVLLENGDIYTAPLATFDGGPGGDGDPEVPPGSSRQYQAYFRLPARVWPDDILAYHLTWVISDSGGAHPQATNFRRSDYNRRVYVGIYGPVYSGYYPWGYYPWGYYSWGSPAFRFGFAPPVYRHSHPRVYPRPRAYPPRVYARPRRR